MMKLFLISGEDDPENDTKDTAPSATQSKGFGAKKAEPAPAPALEKKGFMAKKTEQAAPVAQTGAKKPSFGKKAETVQTVEAEVVESSEEDAAY